MKANDHPLWAKLRDYRVGPPDAALTFAARLARDNGWSADHADRVIGEYRRFLFLTAVAGHEVTPSDAVDQAWHLHLTYSRDYWDRLCSEILARPLHHGPTVGGAAAREHYFTCYAETLASYEIWFGASPPAAIWPSAWQRFHVDPRARRVRLADVWLIPKRAVPLGLLLAAVIAGSGAAWWMMH